MALFIFPLLPQGSVETKQLSTPKIHCKQLLKLIGTFNSENFKYLFMSREDAYDQLVNETVNVYQK